MAVATVSITIKMSEYVLKSYINIYFYHCPIFNKCKNLSLNRYSWLWVTAERRTAIPGWQSPILSDQIILDIPYMESAMFNIKFMYLMLCGIFDIAEWHIKCWNHNTNARLHLAKHSYYNTWFNHKPHMISNTLTIVCSPSWC